jgi:hypothetical protein
MTARCECCCWEPALDVDGVLLGERERVAG